MLLSVPAVPESEKYRAHTIVDTGKREGVDLIMITSQGRAGVYLPFTGIVAQHVGCVLIGSSFVF